MSFQRVIVFLLDGNFLAWDFKPTGWTHVVLNYIGPNDGEGIQAFYNGAEEASGTTKDTSRSYSPGNGRIVMGRVFTDQDQNQASVMIDELIYFNASLTSDDVQSIYNSA